MICNNQSLIYTNFLFLLFDDEIIVYDKEKNLKLFKFENEGLKEILNY